MGKDLEYFQAENFYTRAMRWELWGNLQEQRKPVLLEREDPDGRARGEAGLAPEGPDEGFGCIQDRVLGKYSGALFLVQHHKGWKESEICMLTKVCQGIRWF